jgi:hypothetical protein
MAMGERGMDEMSTMRMPMPKNTLPMMMGDGPFGAVGMGGMFSMVKVRRGQKRNDYSDPGWYRHPPGTVAYEFKGAPPPTTRESGSGGQSMPLSKPVEATVNVRKPRGHSGH